MTDHKLSKKIIQSKVAAQINTSLELKWGTLWNILVAKKFKALVDELIEDILETFLHNARDSIWPVV